MLIFYSLLFLISIIILIFVVSSSKSDSQNINSILDELIKDAGGHIFCSQTTRIEAFLWILSAITLCIKSNEGKRTMRGTPLPGYMDMKNVAVRALKKSFPQLENPETIFYERLECYSEGHRIYAENLTLLCLMADALRGNSDLVDGGMPNIFKYPVVDIFERFRMQPHVSTWIETVFKKLDLDLFLTLVNQDIHSDE